MTVTLIVILIRSHFNVQAHECELRLQMGANSTLDWTSDCMFLLSLSFQWKLSKIMKDLYNEPLWRRSLQIYAQRQRRFISNFLSSFLFFLNHLHSQKSDGTSLRTNRRVQTFCLSINLSVYFYALKQVTGWEDRTPVHHREHMWFTTLTCPGITETNLYVAFILFFYRLSFMVVIQKNNSNNNSNIIIF